MNIKKKTAIHRIVIDLIKADSIIDEDEVRLFSAFKSKYGIESANPGVESLTLADAMSELLKEDFSQEERSALLNDIKQLALSDGTCCKAETLFLLGIEYGLCANGAEIISINVPNLTIVEDQVLYVESKYETAINNCLLDSYRQLSVEFCQAGLSFVYIPKVVERYNHTSEQLFRNVCCFLAPEFSDVKIDGLVRYMNEMTTARLCTEQLYGKLGMSSLYDTNPGFLVNIGSSFVRGRLFYNFLKVDFNDKQSARQQLLAFVDLFNHIISPNAILVTKASEDNGQFFYDGYYKQMFDIYLLQNAQKSSVLIDLNNENIFLPDVNRKFDGPIHTKEKAFYALALFELLNGEPLNYRKPNSVREFEAYDKKLDVYQRRFALLYRSLGGSVGCEPDLSVAETRQQIKSRINKYFKQSVDFLTNTEDYMLSLDKKGGLVFRIDTSLIKVSCGNGVTAFAGSDFFRQLQDIR